MYVMIMAENACMNNEEEEHVVSVNKHRNITLLNFALPKIRSKATIEEPLGSASFVTKSVI